MTEETKNKIEEEMKKVHGNQDSLTLHQKLVKVQNELKAPKSEWNDFNKFAYRSQEGILEAVKPILEHYGLTITLNDSIEFIGDRFYIKATAILSDDHDQICVDAYAREAKEKKGMDDSQLTGSCSSYARKYALCGLFAISNDTDADEEKQENALDQKLLDQCNELKIDLKKVAIYYKKDEKALTNEDLENAIKQQLEARKKAQEKKQQKEASNGAN